MSEIKTPKEFLQEKHEYMRKHWNEHEVIDDEFIAAEMKEYAEYYAAQLANGDNTGDSGLHLQRVSKSLLTCPVCNDYYGIDINHRCFKCGHQY